MVYVCWTDRMGKTCRVVALLEDISRFGACLQLETAVPIGAEIRLECPKRGLHGVVRYCVYREIGYFVGIEFDAKSPWSKRQFKPQHLLDLQKLLVNSKR